MLPTHKRAHIQARKYAIVAGALMTALLLAACGRHESGPTQVVAKVNGSEISVHQVNFAMSTQQGLKGDADAVGKAVLERLVDQELAVQKSVAAKLDRNP